MSGEIDGKTESGTPEANFTLSNNFAVVMGDERFYRLFGEKTLYTFNMLIHPKDRQDFESFMESEDVAAYAVVRCMTANDSYRWFMLEKNNEQANTSEKLKAKLAGINLEGPFISPDRVGAQNPEYVQKPDAEMLQELIDESGNMVKLVTIAPERGGAIECISKLHDKVRFSVGHTMANYDEATLAYESGAKHATHLYNAMTGLNHRNPGVVGAARDAKNVTAELICDGVHIHPSVVRATFSMFGSDRVILISDSMRACGMPDGESELGGQVVIKKGNEARLVTGELAGSVTNVYDCMVKAIEFGIPIADAIKAATYNPAKAIGILDEFGTIEIGKKPGFVLVNEDFSINQVL